jgi:DNA-binding response OmpR family regulator
MSIHEDVLNSVSVLIVEDKEVVTEGLHFYLKNRVADIYMASNVDEGLEIYRTRSPQIIIIDLALLPLSDMEMIETIRQKDKETTIILVSGNNTQSHFIKAIEIGINRYLPRPANRSELLETLIVEADKILLRQEIEALDRRLENSRRFEGLKA